MDEIETAPLEDAPQETADVETGTNEAPTFSADYVKSLRDENAKQRMKAKRTDEANQRLLESIVHIDGRLVDSSALSLDDSLLDDRGLVDQAKVQERIQEMIQSKPYLRKPVAPLPQGVLTSPQDTPSLFQLVRERI